MSVKSILHLNGDQRITSLFTDAISNCVFIGLSDGRIIKAEKSVVNAYATGNRTVSSIIENGYGSVSNEVFNKAIYLCRNQILQVEQEGYISSRWETENPFSANRTYEIEGIFTSQALYAGDDFIVWKDVLWESSGLEDSEILIQVRVGKTEQELLSKEWLSFDTLNTSETRSLNSLNGNGSWIQVRAILKTSERDFSPSINTISISYQTRYAVYFFTTKFTMERGANLKSGLIVANMNVPQNTEIKVGIVDSNTADWTKYNIVPLDRAFPIIPENSERLKIGFKFISHYPASYANVDEFAMMVSGEKMKSLKVT